VRANSIRKSVGAENTFFEDLTQFKPMREELLPLIGKVWRYCETSRCRGRTVVLKVKYADFQIITRSRTMPSPVASLTELEETSLDLLQQLMPVPKGIRLLGVTLSSLETEDELATGQPQMRLAL
jgi:DNA polymerase-4